jgi:serine/threonine-protein kinase RsbT
MADALRFPQRPALRLAARRYVRRGDWRPDRPAFDESTAGMPAQLGPDLVEVLVRLAGEEGLVEARRQGRLLAARTGFRETDRAVIAAIVSELGRNILLYGASGEIALAVVELGQRIGVRIAARDEGPGIPDIMRAMRDGYSSVGRLGLGLPGVRRLADEFEITSAPGRGTHVVVTKWRS